MATFNEYKEPVFTYLRETICGSQEFSSLLGSDLIPKRVAIPYFIKAIKEFIGRDESDQYIVEVNSNELGFTKRETSSFTHNPPKRPTADWGDLDKLEKKLRNKKYRKVVVIDECTTISPKDIGKFLDTHFACLRNSNSLTLMPYYDRLLKV